MSNYNKVRVMFRTLCNPTGICNKYLRKWLDKFDHTKSMWTAIKPADLFRLWFWMCRYTHIIFKYITFCRWSNCASIRKWIWRTLHPSFWWAFVNNLIACVNKATQKYLSKEHSPLEGRIRTVLWLNVKESNYSVILPITM